MGFLHSPVSHFSLGSIDYRDLYCVLSLDPTGDDLLDGLLGTGALLPFARIGIDLNTAKLELECGPTVDPAFLAKETSNRLVISGVGAFRGFTLFAPEPSLCGGKKTLPRVGSVYSQTPAARAGLVVDDLIVSIDGQACHGRSMQAIARDLWRADKKQLILVCVRANREPIEMRLVRS